MEKKHSYSAPFEDGTPMQAYFDTLPKGIQELFIQSGARVSTEQELRQCVQQLTGKTQK